MPEQASARAAAITTAPITDPFQTAVWPYGTGGLNLKDQLDAIPPGEYSRLTNCIHTTDRGLTSRVGLTTVATGGTSHHSVRRLHDPAAATDTRIWGIDQQLYRGLSGALTQIDTGYSGDPLTLLPHRPPLSGDPWMFVADRVRMRKVRFDGLDLPIGLPAPVTAPTLTLDTEQFTPIAGFDPVWFGDDGTRASLWTGNAGYDFSDPPIPTAAPTVNDNGEFIANPGAAVGEANKGFYTFWGLAKSIDLSLVGTKDAVDDDIMHLIMLLTFPHLVAEVRLYLVCSGDFDPTVLPGTAAGRSTNFYMKTFRPSDFASVVAAAQTTDAASEAARRAELRNQSLLDQSESGGFSVGRTRNVAREEAFLNPPTPTGPVRTQPRPRADATYQAQRDPSRSTTTEAGGGVAEFVHFGTVGIPLRRGEWKRFGSTPNRDWSTITGLVIFYQALPGTGSGGTSVALLDWKLTGGAGPDTIEPGAQSYDYRYTHYDPRTGAEGNPSPEVTDQTLYIDSARRGILVDPASHGDSAIRQRIYRRGGSIIEDWFFAGENASDGGVFLDEESDDGIVNAGTVNLDHYEPVATVDDNGDTVLAQPIPVIFGPAQGMLFGLGDPHRPGHLYWCIPDQPDHWGAEQNVEVCSPSEELMAGFMAGAQPFCFSRERLYAVYPNLSTASEVVVTTTACRRGIVSRTSWAVGLGGIYGVAKDGLFQTAGGAEQVISHPIFRLFEGETWNGYSPINFDFPHAIRLSICQDMLYFLYQGQDGNRYVLVYSLQDKFWLIYDFAIDPAYVLSDDDTPTANILVGGLISGKSYLHDGFSDDGVAITCQARTGTWDLGRPREDKLLGDQIVDADLQGVTASLTNRLNNESITNPAQAFDAGSGRQRYIFDGFGVTPQRARNLSCDLNWSSSEARPTFYFMGLAVIPEPDMTVNRVTQWDDLGHPDESYMTGITLDVDTGNQPRTIHFERDFLGVTTIMHTAVVQTNGRHKVKFSWTALPAHKVRIRPEDDCVAWILYRADWISVPEPPRIALWDIHFEADGDQYYTGLDLYCDTNGVEKRIEIYVDGTRLVNYLAGGLTYWPITTIGRQWVHFTLPWGRGHVFHFIAIDQNPGLLYKHKWWVDPEPSEQANWNQNFSIYGTRADKWMKALVLECDTFGITKSVEVQVDGITVETLSVNTTGRKVVQIALAAQKLGRVWRMFPVDGNPGRLYTAQPVFDEEPFSLDRWETQELTFDQHGFSIPIEGQITLKSTIPVTLTLSTYVNQLGTVVVDTYTIPSTGGIKDKRYVPFQARKGVLFKFLFTAGTSFYLYQEESSVLIQPWGSSQPIMVRPFGNADVDRTRSMVTSALAAGRSGGGTA